MPALNVLFRNKVVEANQFSLAALALLAFRFCGWRIFLVLRCIHLASTYISICAKFPAQGKNWRSERSLSLNQNYLEMK